MGDVIPFGNRQPFRRPPPTMSLPRPDDEVQYIIQTLSPDALCDWLLTDPATFFAYVGPRQQIRLLLWLHLHPGLPHLLLTHHVSVLRDEIDALRCGHALHLVRVLPGLSWPVPPSS